MSHNMHCFRTIQQYRLMCPLGPQDFLGAIMGAVGQQNIIFYSRTWNWKKNHIIYTCNDMHYDITQGDYGPNVLVPMAPHEINAALGSAVFFNQRKLRLS